MQPSRSGPGFACPERRERRSRRKLSCCRCRVSRGRSPSAGRSDVVARLGRLTRRLGCQRSRRREGGSTGCGSAFESVVELNAVIGTRGRVSRLPLHISLFELRQNKKRAKRFAICDLGNLSVSDGEPLKYSRVVELARVAVGRPIRLSAIGGELEGDAEHLLPLGQCRLDILEPLLDFPNVACNPLLLAAQQSDVDRSRVVGLEQLAPFRLNLGQLASEELALAGVAVLAGDDLGLHRCAQTL